VGYLFISSFWHALFHLVLLELIEVGLDTNFDVIIHKNCGN
jgi:hypothetical protein